MAAAIDRRRILAIILRRRRSIRFKLLYFLYILQKKKEKTKKRFWVRQIYRDRKEKGEFALLVRQAKLVDHEIFYRMFRMSPTKFDELLSIVGPKLRRDSRRREPIGPQERLAVALRFLTTGDSFITISNSYRMSDTSVGRIVRDTCQHIWNELSKVGYLNVPNSNIELLKTANNF